MSSRKFSKVYGIFPFKLIKSIYENPTTSLKSFKNDELLWYIGQTNNNKRYSQHCSGSPFIYRIDKTTVKNNLNTSKKDNKKAYKVINLNEEPYIILPLYYNEEYNKIKLDTIEAYYISNLYACLNDKRDGCVGLDCLIEFDVLDDLVEKYELYPFKNSIINDETFNCCDYINLTNNIPDIVYKINDKYKNISLHQKLKDNDIITFFKDLCIKNKDDIELYINHIDPKPIELTKPIKIIEQTKKASPTEICLSLENTTTTGFKCPHCPKIYKFKTGHYNKHVEKCSV
jgi:hypothetical protein